MPIIDNELLDKKHGFYRDLLVGHFHKDLIRVILEESGYEVYPYGYESFLTPLKIKFEKRKIKQTAISRKIRSTPDLLVYNPENNNVQLCEVKSRNWDRTDDVLIQNVSRYRKHWQESILAVVLPAGHFFYAQHVDKLKPRTDNSFDLNEEFELFEDIFIQVKLDTLYLYKERVIGFWNRETERYEPLSSNVLERFSLHFLIRQLGKCTTDELFFAQNKRNLISRKDFDEAVKALINEGKIIKDEGEIRFVS